MSDGRPEVAIGHVRLHCGDLKRAQEFYLALGMRPCMAWDGVSILELRGGTHLLLIQSPDAMMEILDPVFDLMVDDIKAFREGLITRGLKPSEISIHEIAQHQRCFVTDPDGRRIAIHSDHAEGRKV